MESENMVELRKRFKAFRSYVDGQQVYETAFREYVLKMDEERCAWAAEHPDALRELRMKVQSVSEMSPYSYSFARDIFREVSKGLGHQVCSTTKVVLDPAVDAVTASSNVWGKKIVAVGKFGWGIRHNRQAQALRNSYEFWFLVKNKDVIIKNLQNLKLVKEAQIFSDLMDAMPHSAEFGMREEGVVFDLPQEVELIGNDGFSIKGRTLRFRNQGLSLSGISSNNYADCLPTTAYGYYNYKTVEQFLPKVFEDADERRALVSDVRQPEIIANVKGVLGRFLLLRAL